MISRSALEVYDCVVEGDMNRSDFLSWLYKRCELESEAHAELYMQEMKLIVVSKQTFNGYRPIAAYFSQEKADIAIAELFAYNRAAYPMLHFDDDHFVSCSISIEPTNTWIDNEPHHNTQCRQLS